ncbi:Mov34/MPN/PAD-1 family protein [Amphritea atlantica]|uniref:Mov34/MPN/PAD-1 family protein n=1 Tax=Amphritea atlantica TaxID=355243 RepID=A0ABY5GST0_9GAMM|nr:Mov34/MPN/PAD-1 family protein [Amphritea atlantica]
MEYSPNKLWLPKELHDEIISEIEHWHPYETGGVLMGYTGSNGDVVVTYLIPCGENSVHKRMSFEPDQEFQLQKISKIYTESSGNITYLGDWHSHPKSTSELSSADKRTLTKVALTKASKCPYPVMMIFAEIPSRWTVNVVRFVKGRRSIWPFSYCNYEKIDCVID